MAPEVCSLTEQPQLPKDERRMNLEQWEIVEEVDGHRWGYWKGDKRHQCCAICGYVRRDDKKNKPCRGPVKMRPLEPLITPDNQ